MSSIRCPNEKPISITDSIWCDDPSCPFVHWTDYGTDKWQSYLKARISEVVDNKMYWFLTFTKKPDSKIHEWFDLVIRSLHSKQIEIVNLTMEHLDTNVHVHAFVSSLNNLSRDKFKAFSSRHILDIKKIKKDNGINEYLNKENKAFDKIDEFEIYYRNLILEKN